MFIIEFIPNGSSHLMTEECSFRDLDRVIDRLRHERADIFNCYEVEEPVPADEQEEAA